MRLKELGKTGEKIPEIGMGTWKLGKDPEQEVRALKKGFELGMRFVDTAEMYNTEDIVASAIEGEKGIFVATKVSPHHFKYEDVIRSCEASLARLKVKSIDLYQLHWPNPNVPIAETMRAMEELVERRMIRYIGVSNFSIREMEEAQASMKKNVIVSNQVEYSPLVREVEEGLLDYCNKNRITIIAYSPFGSGSLFSAKNAKVKKKLEEIGQRYQKSAVQVALGWLLSKGDVVAIPKASSPEHIAELAGGSDFSMSKEDIESLDHFL